MVGNRINLTNCKRGKDARAETLSIAFWNSFGLSVEGMDYLVGSQDGEVKGMDHDLIGLG